MPRAIIIAVTLQDEDTAVVDTPQSAFDRVVFETTQRVPEVRQVQWLDPRDRWEDPPNTSRGHEGLGYLRPRT